MILQIVKGIAVILIAIGFAFSVALLELAPYRWGDVIFSIALAGFLSTYFLMTPHLRNHLAFVAILTSLCTFGIFFWFNFGYMQQGWWYPSTLPIVQQFVHVDGEASYDAAVTNLILIVWVVGLLCFGGYHLAKK